MQLITIVFLIFLLVLSKIYCLIDFRIVEDYFRYLRHSNGIVLTCFNKSEYLQLSKTLINKTYSISNINDPITEKKLSLQLNIILDGDCPEIGPFLLKCGKNKFFSRKYHWLIIDSNRTTVNKFGDTILNIDSDIKILTPSAAVGVKINNYTIANVYNPAAEHGGELKSITIGYYNSISGFKILPQPEKYWIRRNLTGITFKTKIVLPVAFEGSLEDYLESDDDRNVNTFNRFHCRLIHFCRDYYNFSLNISLERSWGYSNTNGKFDGMVGALDNKLIDFGCSPLFIRNDREMIIDYGVNTWIFRSAFIFRNPKSLSSFGVFITPLSLNVWIVFLAFAFLSIVILKYVTSYEKNNDHSDIETNWSYSILFTISAICQQGSPRTPKLYCGRIITISIFLLFLLVYQFYAASIVSHLLFKIPTIIKTLTDLIDSTLKVGCEDTLYNRDYFMRTPDEIVQRLYFNKIYRKNNNSNFLIPEQGLYYVEKGNYAFHVELAAAYPIIEKTFRHKAICELREVKLFETQPMNANFQKNSPFRDMINSCLLRLAENGVLYREKAFWHPRKPVCISSTSKTVLVNVGLNEFYPVLLVLFFGIVISLVILIIERRTKVKRNVKKKRNNKEDVVWPFVQ